MVVTIIAVIVIIIDQLTKWWAYASLRTNGDITLIKDVLHLHYTTNKGMAFGLLEDQRWVFLTLTAVIIIAVIAFLVYTRKKKKHIMLNASLAMIVGGGIGNMIDRIFYGDALFCGEVIDFIYFKLIDFPVFNIADSAVCIGEALLVMYILFLDGKIAKNNADLFSFSQEQTTKE